MINFFRKIRKQYADDNRPIKYLRYAIGEIVLVVIGILIALQLNTWKENSIEHKKEAIYLQNIKRDLQVQLIKMEAQIDYESRINKAAKPIIQEFTETKTFHIDSIFTESIGILSSRKTFVKVDPTYTELLSSGHIDIIRDNDFKNKLIMYYQNLERIEQIIYNNNFFTDATFTDKIMELTEVRVVGFYKYEDALRKSVIENFTGINEPFLREITVDLLENPKNKLLMINLINRRNFVAKLHIDFLEDQKVKTKALLDKLEQLF